MNLRQFNFKRVTSTNDIAIKLIKKNYKSGMIISDMQNRGRGRYGRKWVSLNGNLFVSIFFSLEKINLTLKEMTKVNCLLIKKVLSYYYNKKITIKDPNDLLINKRKICGILQETLNKKDKTYIIIGIGINLIKSPKNKNYLSTSLLEETNNIVNKKKIILKLKKIFENFIQKIYMKNNIKILKKI